MLFDPRSASWSRSCCSCFSCFNYLSDFSPQLRCCAELPPLPVGCDSSFILPVTPPYAPKSTFLRVLADADVLFRFRYVSVLIGMTIWPLGNILPLRVPSALLRDFCLLSVSSGFPVLPLISCSPFTCVLYLVLPERPQLALPSLAYSVLFGLGGVFHSTLFLRPPVVQGTFH